MTWPVLELLGNNAEFFLARHSPKVEILLLGVVLALGLPAFLAALGSLPGKGGNLVGLGLIAVLSTLLGFLYLRRLPVPWWTAAATAILVGSVATWAFLRFDPARQATRYLLPAPLLFRRSSSSPPLRVPFSSIGARGSAQQRKWGTRFPSS
jgi:hypothetical protein